MFLKRWMAFVKICSDFQRIISHITTKWKIKMSNEHISRTSHKKIHNIALSLVCIHGYFIAPPRQILRDTVNERAVRVLLECILVYSIFADNCLILRADWNLCMGLQFTCRHNNLPILSLQWSPNPHILVLNQLHCVRMQRIFLSTLSFY